MAEERVVDDDINKGVKLRKTGEGYAVADGEGTEEPTEEFSFAFPEMDEEDDEDLVGLSPEEALALRRQKAEAAERRRAEYEEAVAAGNRMLEEKAYGEAEKKFEEALLLDGVATEASVGYWRAKTQNFENPDILAGEYVEAGIESLEYDLGYEATEQIKKDYRPVFERRYKELSEEEEPLSLQVSETQSRRRAILKGRRKTSILAFILSALPFIACLTLAILYATKITSTPDGRYIPYTVAFAIGGVITFIVFAVFTNKLINTLRIYKRNETLTSTEEGERLAEIMDYKDIYGGLLDLEADEE